MSSYAISWYPVFYSTDIHNGNNWFVLDASYKSVLGLNSTEKKTRFQHTQPDRAAQAFIQAEIVGIEFRIISLQNPVRS